MAPLFLLRANKISALSLTDEEKEGVVFIPGATPFFSLLQVCVTVL
jgi:hypothetical protein